MVNFCSTVLALVLPTVQQVLTKRTLLTLGPPLLILHFNLLNIAIARSIVRPVLVSMIDPIGDLSEQVTWNP